MPASPYPAEQSPPRKGPIDDLNMRVLRHVYDDLAAIRAYRLGGYDAEKLARAIERLQDALFFAGDHEVIEDQCMPHVFKS